MVYSRVIKSLLAFTILKLLNFQVMGLILMMTNQVPTCQSEVVNNKSILMMGLILMMTNQVPTC